jgi:hypothetical protein
MLVDDVPPSIVLTESDGEPKFELDSLAAA